MTDEDEIGIQFGTGSIIGRIGSDDFHLGPMTVKGQAFAEITTQEGQVFATDRFSGVAGLAFPALAAYSSKPWFDNVRGILLSIQRENRRISKDRLKIV